MWEAIVPWENAEKEGPREERWQRACNILKPAAPLTALLVMRVQKKKEVLDRGTGMKRISMKTAQIREVTKQIRKVPKGSYTNSLIAGHTQISNYLCPSHLLLTKDQGLFTHLFNIFWWNT